VRVAFLFNHAVPHQVPHAAPFAFVLSRECPQIDVIIACSIIVYSFFLETEPFQVISGR